MKYLTDKQIQEVGVKYLEICRDELGDEYYRDCCENLQDVINAVSDHNQHMINAIHAIDSDACFFMMRDIFEDRSMATFNACFDAAKAAFR